MATNTFVAINIPEAAELADLSGISNDFECAKQFAKRLKEIRESGQPDISLIEPLTIATLVRYSRPFTTGVRHRLENHELLTLSQVQKVAHDRLRDWRDKHIAHSVNVFEDNQPVARYWIERFEDEGFSSVECNSNNLVGMSIGDTEMVIELCNHFLERLKLQIEAEKQKVLEVVRSLPKEQVLSMNKPKELPKINDVAKVRKR